MRRLLLLLAGLLAPLRAYEPDWGKLQGLARGKVETCGGWWLNRLKEVKAFVTEDIPLYHNLVMKHLPGADPELVLLSFRYEELERIPLSDMSREEINQLVQELGFYRKEAPDALRIPLSDMSREEINQLVQELGFYRKEAPDALVPEEFQLAPARPLPTLQAKEQDAGPPFPPAPAAKSEHPRMPGKQEHPDL